MESSRYSQLSALEVHLYYNSPSVSVLLLLTCVCDIMCMTLCVYTCACIHVYACMHDLYLLSNCWTDHIQIFRRF